MFTKNYVPWNKGKKTGLVPKSAFKKGHVAWYKLKPHKLTAWNKGLKLPNQTGEKHFAWKGDNVSYRNLHKWIVRNLGKANKCMNNLDHKSTRYHWANVSHEYKRDLSDWVQMCPSCNGKDRVGKRVSP